LIDSFGGNCPVKFLKPIVGGVAAILAAALLMSTPLFVWMLRYPAKDGYYVVIHWHVWKALCIAVLVFSAGFSWQYRNSRPA
jgi:hypothetical protein